MTSLPRTLVVRLWLPDRPGALGQVASRIGAVRGDLLAIDILERGGGQVIDELVVVLPPETSEDLLAREIAAVDGVAVEQIRAAGEQWSESAMAMFELCAAIAEAPPDLAAAVLCSGLRAALDADWAALIGADGIVAADGEAPPDTWLQAFVDGSGHLADVADGPADVVRAPLPTCALVVAAGRSQRAMHERERARVQVLARVADTLLGASPG